DCFIPSPTCSKSRRADDQSQLSAGLGEHELIVSVAEGRLDVLQCKPLGLEIVEDFIHAGDLERITSQPVMHVVKDRHASLSLVLRKHVMPTDDAQHGRLDYEVWDVRCIDGRSPEQVGAIQLLDPAPDLRLATLVIIKGYA